MPSLIDLILLATALMVAGVTAVSLFFWMAVVLASFVALGLMALAFGGMRGLKRR